MRKAIRVTVLVLVAYLIQTTMLSHLKVSGVMIDLVPVVLFTIGYVLGPYPGLMAGLMAGLLLEISYSDLAGLTAALCLIAGGLGAWSAVRLSAYDLPGRRKLERNIKRYAPIVVMILYELGKETIYLVYFYLTGMDVLTAHWIRLFVAGLLVGLASVVVMPFVRHMLTRKPEDTFFAKRRRKWKARLEEKKKEKELKEIKTQETPSELPLDFIEMYEMEALRAILGDEEDEEEQADAQEKSGAAETDDTPDESGEPEETPAQGGIDDEKE